MTTTLSPDQARALWEAGGFALLTGLPMGSETGMDGTFHTINVFAGHKFVPPGLHSIVWSATPSSSTSTTTQSSTEAQPQSEASASADIAAAFPIRSAFLHFWQPKERVVLHYDPGTESTTRKPGSPPIDEPELQALDPQLAPYPFAQLAAWKSLSTHITPPVLARVCPSGRVDSLTAAAGEEGDEIKELRAAVNKGAATTAAAGEREPLAFPVFDLKRSWNEGASGEEVTRWSRDKSMLLARVCAEVGGPAALLGHLQLSHILVSHVWSYASLGPYKRLLRLLCRSEAALADPATVGLPESTRDVYIALLSTLAAQLRALPNAAFDAELPDMREFYEVEIDALRKGLGHALGERGWWGKVGEVGAKWKGLQAAAADKGLVLLEVSAGDEDSDEEEGEYAPVVVET